MLTTLIICVCLGTNVLAANPSLSISEEKELEDIAATCLTTREEEQLSGSIVRYNLAILINIRLSGEATQAIGLQELRAVAGFAPPGLWVAKCRRRRKTRDQIADNVTVVEYYELREPLSRNQCLDAGYFFEKNIADAVHFFDNRFPVIRKIFRRRFEAIRSEKKMDKDIVDQMIEEYIHTYVRIEKAVLKLVSGSTECTLARWAEEDKIRSEK